MSYIINHSPGQLVTIFWEVLDSTGNRSDGYTLDGYDFPTVQRIIFPNLSLASGYPKFFDRVDVGLYRMQFLLPSGSSAVGTYFVDITYLDPENIGLSKQSNVLINCQAAYGKYSATVG